jgi:putative flippase GtrA
MFLNVRAVHECMVNLLQSSEMNTLSLALFGKTAKVYIQFLRYGLVSVVAVSVDFGGLIVLKQYGHVDYILAASISFIAGLFVNYVLSIFWVFQNSRFTNRWYEFALFAVIGIVGLGFTDLILWVLTTGLGLFYVLSKIIATVVVYFWNFGIRKKFVFN